VCVGVRWFVAFGAHGDAASARVCECFGCFRVRVGVLCCVCVCMFLCVLVSGMRGE